MARTVHRVVVACPAGPRTLILEPMGMVLELPADDEVVVEVIAAAPPEVHDAPAEVVVFIGGGDELRVTRGDAALYDTLGRPCPAGPPGTSTAELLRLLGLTPGGPAR